MVHRVRRLRQHCEGSEFSILEHADLSRVRLIVGEWHDRDRFWELVGRKFADWKLRIIKDGQLGLFWLSRHGTKGEPLVPKITRTHPSRRMTLRTTSASRSP